MPVRELPARPGLTATELPDAILRGDVTALYIEGTLDGRDRVLDPLLLAALPSLDVLIVAEAFPSPLTGLADIVLPLTTSIEKDGSFTSFDRTVQRVRSAVAAPGEARAPFEIIQTIARRFGYDMSYRHPSQVMSELSRLTELYRGVAFARLERGGMTVPTTGRVGTGLTVLPLATAGSGPLTLRPRETFPD